MAMHSRTLWSLLALSFSTLMFRLYIYCQIISRPSDLWLVWIFNHRLVIDSDSEASITCYDGHSHSTSCHCESFTLSPFSSSCSFCSLHTQALVTEEIVPLPISAGVCSPNHLDFCSIKWFRRCTLTATHTIRQTQPSNLQKPWFQFGSNESCGVHFLFSLSRVLTDSSQSSQQRYASGRSLRDKECERLSVRMEYHWESGIEGVYLYYCQGSGPILSSILETSKNNF